MFAFERKLEEEWIVIIFNLDEEENFVEIPLKEKRIIYQELISNENGSAGGSGDDATLLVNIPGKSVRIYKIFKSGGLDD